jgi:hypothetical protein
MSQYAFLPEAILALVVVEFIALVIWRARRGKGPSPLDIAANLAAGACLLLAVRAALLGQETMLLVFLAASGLAHVADLARRWR